MRATNFSVGQCASCRKDLYESLLVDGLCSPCYSKAQCQILRAVLGDDVVSKWEAELDKIEQELNQQQ